MANELSIDYASGNALYAVIRNASGQVWYPAGATFEDWGTSGRDADDYDVALVDKSGCRYVGSIDTNIPAGRYTAQFFVQAGADPTDGDTLVGCSELRWSGSGVVTADKLLANRAVQDKQSGSIAYYDDDCQTVLLSLAPEDAEAELSRTPV